MNYTLFINLECLVVSHPGAGLRDVRRQMMTDRLTEGCFVRLFGALKKCGKKNKCYFM